MFSSLVFLSLGLTFTALVFGVASNLILIALPLIFAPEIRHYLEKLGRFPFIGFTTLTETQKTQKFIRDLADGLEELATTRTGATVIIQRRTGIGETTETGVYLNAAFSSKLLANLFFKNSPLHDGAVIIRNRKIMYAGCLLPISGEVKLDKKFGTRHRSALSITRDTDVVAIIVSEQRGELTLAENSKWYTAISKQELIERLNKLLIPKLSTHPFPTKLIHRPEIVPAALPEN